MVRCACKLVGAILCLSVSMPWSPSSYGLVLVLRGVKTCQQSQEIMRRGGEEGQRWRARHIWQRYSTSPTRRIVKAPDLLGVQDVACLPRRQQQHPGDRKVE